VCRKDSHVYVQILKGNYQTQELPTLLQQLTTTEAKFLQNLQNFEEFWNSAKLTDFAKSKKYFSERQFSANIGEIKEILTDEFIEKLPPTAEWGFPKGKEERGEDILTTALREFREETGYSKADYSVLKHEDGEPVTIQEDFVVSLSGGRCMQKINTFFLVSIANIANRGMAVDNEEISKVEWFTPTDSKQLHGISQAQHKTIDKVVTLLENVAELGGGR
jgi:ADP-ribose pyrophosphatase YjhB (NUDIX family)